MQVIALKLSYIICKFFTTQKVISINKSDQSIQNTTQQKLKSTEPLSLSKTSVMEFRQDIIQAFLQIKNTCQFILAKVGQSSLRPPPVQIQTAPSKTSNLRPFLSKDPFSHQPPVSSQKISSVGSQKQCFDLIQDSTSQNGDVVKNQANNAKTFHTPKAKPHPQKPKNPLTPYFLFFKLKRSYIQQKYKDLSQSQMANVAGQVWRSLSADQKKPYEEQYQKNRKLYDIQLQKFYKKYPNQRTKLQIRRVKKLNQTQEEMDHLKHEYD